MRIILATALLLAAFAAHAFDTYAFPRGIVSVGDSTAVLIQKGGQPSRIVTLENHRGAAVGERWEYYLRDKQVNFTIHDGRVKRVDEIR
ncbi:hypothetical protein [Denitratimonas tolerans]|uniref:DUF2845 domain-containing protein n=1 Tax=Denitratimonas tolerans TaxID=1338420 RepID=A0AAW9R632_9GAMM